MEAIGWAESNEQFVPLYISHGSHEFSCWWQYAYPESDSLGKEIDCDTTDNLYAKYCTEDDDCKSTMSNHEH